MREIIMFNDLLTEKGETVLNETDLEDLISRYAAISSPGAAVSCLTLARIAELGLRCAGDYADAREFQAAGDLLINPRKVNVYVNGALSPVRKERHTAVSAQLAFMTTSENPVCWLTRNTWTHIKQQAILPCLYQVIESSGLMSKSYLQSVNSRMCKIADLIGSLSAWDTGSHRESGSGSRPAAPEVRNFIDNHLCRFDLRIFKAMENDIHEIIMGNSASRFLKRDVFVTEPGVFFRSSLCQI